MSKCTDKHDKADLLVRGHYCRQVYGKLAGMEIALFSRNVGVQQGHGSSPALLTSLVETLLWREWDQAAAAHRWGVKVGPPRTHRTSWTADNICLADENKCLPQSVLMLRTMLREISPSAECRWTGATPTNALGLPRTTDPSTAFRSRGRHAYIKSKSSAFWAVCLPPLLTRFYGRG